MHIVDLKKKPYCLNDKQAAWVEDTLASMTLEEKIGQLFVYMVSDRTPENIKKIVHTYHPAAARYSGAPAKEVYEQNKLLQTESKIPMLIAANLAEGGKGGCTDGTYVGAQAAIVASGDANNALRTAQISASEAAAMGVNWGFDPIVDILYNWRNTVIQTRAYTNNPDDVLKYAKAYIKGIDKKIATCCKHFPGDGMDENDQHLMLSVNTMSCEEWDETYGRIYKELIDDGVMTIMAGHIAMPAYQDRLDPDAKEYLPATLCPALINNLLKDQLDFNGLVVTDASHMVGMFGATMPRCEQVPRAIAAGCDLFLFFNDVEEDFNYMLEGYKKGIITEERLNDAIRRTLGLKALMGLPEKKAAGTLVPPEEGLAVVGCSEYQATAKEIADQYITLVRDKDNYLPMDPAKGNKIKLVYIGGDGTFVAGKRVSGGAVQQGLARLKSELEAEGFVVDAEEMTARGKMEEFKKNYDYVVLAIDNYGIGISNAVRIKWAQPILQPWYMSEVPTVVISLGYTNCLVDIPHARCYINAFSTESVCVHAAVEKMVGKSAFKGIYNENVFCGREDTK